MTPNGPSRIEGTKERFQFCPVCGNDCWAYIVDAEKGEHCFACGAHKAGDVTIDFSDSGVSSVPYWSEIELPPHKDLSPFAVDYLINRGVSTEDAKLLGLVEMVDEPRILIPYFDLSGRLIYWSARAYEDIGPRYKNVKGIKHPLYFPFGGLKVRQKLTIFVEGQFDAIKVAKAGYNVCALGGKQLHKHLRASVKYMMSYFDPGKIGIFLDGEALTESIELSEEIQELTGLPVHILCPNTGQDPGSMSLNEINNLLGDYTS